MLCVTVFIVSFICKRVFISWSLCEAPQKRPPPAPHYPASLFPPSTVISVAAALWTYVDQEQTT